MHRRISKAFCIAATITAIVFGVVSCDPPKPSSSPPPSDTTVSETGADFAIAGVKISVPPGAVSARTKVNAAFDDRTPTGVSTPDLKLLAKGFKITLGNGLQPAKPLAVTIPIDKTLLAGGQDAATGVLMMVQSDGADAPDLVTATYDPAAGTVTAQIPHLSWVWPAQFDLAPLVNGVRDTLVQAWNVESPRPSCADQPLTVGTTTYTPISPPSAWLCLEQSNGSLVVAAMPNSPVPFMISTSPTSSASSQADLSVANAVSTAMTHWYTAANQAVIMPGTSAKFTFTGAPSENVQLGFNQFPVMMLNAILAQLLDQALGSDHFVPSEVIAGGGCLQQVAETTRAAGALGDPKASGNSLSVEVAADLIKSFLTCAGSLMKLAPAGQVLYAILTSGTFFLATAVLGIANEIMQLFHVANTASFVSTIVASAAPVPVQPPSPPAGGSRFAGTIRGGIQLNGMPSPNMVNVKLRLPSDWSAKANPAYGDTGIDIVNPTGEKRLMMLFYDDLAEPCPGSSYKQLEDVPVSVSGVGSPPPGGHLGLVSRLFTRGPGTAQDFPLALYVTLGYSPDPMFTYGSEACPYGPYFKVGPVYGRLFQELGFESEQAAADFMAGPNFKKLKDTMASFEVELAK